MKRKLSLIVGLAGVLYALVLLCIRITDLGLWFILLASLPPLWGGLFPQKFGEFFRTRPGKALRILLLTGYGLVGISFAVIACFIASYAAAPPDPGADAVIVLGGGLWGEKPSPALAKRLDVGLAYATENPNAWVVVSGGRGPDEPRTEASAMAEYLVEQGLDPARLILEENSYSTYDNFRLCREILDARLGSDYRVVFVTSDFHVLRSTHLAEKEGLQAQGLSAPSSPFWIPSFYVREYMVILKYWIFGAEGLPWLSRVF